MRHVYNIIMYKGLAMATLLLLSLCAWGQEDGSLLSSEISQPNKEVLHSSMIGMGSSNVLDTYLSSYNYTGKDYRIQRETMRMTNLWKGRVSNQSLIDLNVDFNKNHARNIKEYAGGIRYSQGWFYNFMNGNTVNPVERSASRFNFAAGLAASGYLGVVYIDRSGNNPAQAKADLMIDVSGLATYDLVIAKHHYLWRYQVSFPLMGIAFSPNYGQSYYEAFVAKHYDHNVVFAYPGNMPSMRHKLTLDIPIKRYTLRVGYVAQINQSIFNHLKYHSYSHDFMIGFNKYLYRR
ncbi:MAG: DUF3316 domain-containing protein [Bacteroidaceae bacterium]|nr:DUF3316 domain-containing protein [Bacteroidaceae bacterium]